MGNPQNFLGQSSLKPIKVFFNYVAESTAYAVIIVLKHGVDRAFFGSIHGKDFTQSRQVIVTQTGDGIHITHNLKPEEHFWIPRESILVFKERKL